MKKWVVFLLVLSFSFTSLAQQNKINIAVLKFESNGTLSEAEELALTNRLRSLLVQQQIFTVVERGRMEEILNEVGFQQTGCTSIECAVEAGRILNVQQMIAGNIGKLGKLYTLDISVIDVETAQIIKSISRDYSGEIEGLIEFMAVIAREIGGEEEGQQPSETVSEKQPAEASEQIRQPVALKKSEGKKWLWIIVGGAAVGGTAAILLMSQGKESPAQTANTLPDPPSRP